MGNGAASEPFHARSLALLPRESPTLHQLVARNVPRCGPRRASPKGITPDFRRTTLENPRYSAELIPARQKPFAPQEWKQDFTSSRMILTSRSGVPLNSFPSIPAQVVSRQSASSASTSALLNSFQAWSKGKTQSASPMSSPHQIRNYIIWNAMFPKGS